LANLTTELPPTPFTLACSQFDIAISAARLRENFNRYNNLDYIMHPATLLALSEL
jgi:hypothetical protein